MYTFVSIPSSSAWIKWTDFGWFMYGGPQGHAANQKVAANKIKLQQIWNSCSKFSKNSLSWILFTHVKPVKYKCVNYVKFKRQWKSTFISIFLNKKLRNMKHQIFSHKLLLKEKSLTVLFAAVFIESSFFSFSFVILNFIIMRTKHLYGINNKSNGLGVERMYVMTCVYQ